MQRGDRVSFDVVAKSLRPLAILSHNETSAATALNELKTIPVRICQPNKPIVQRPVAIWRKLAHAKDPSVHTDTTEAEHKQMRTLNEVLNEDFKEVYDCPNQNKYVECIIQGIEVPLDAPIFDLWRLMSNCDLYLYITLRMVDR